jgi:hypothetical protein
MENPALVDFTQRETFNMFYHGDNLSAMEMSCIRSFLKHGHQVRMFSYNKLDLPEGVIFEDAQRILPSDQLFIFDNSPSGFSNIFRYKLLLEQGGWWVDTDVVCLSSWIPVCDYFWAEQAPGEINGAVLKFPAGDPRLKHLLEQSIKRSKYLQVWGQLGPHLLTEVLKGDLPPKHIGTTELVYPIHNTEVHYLWLPEFYEMVERRCSHAIFLHLWHAMYARMGIDLECSPPKGSYLRALYDTFGVFLPYREEDELTTRRSIINFLINIGKVDTIVPDNMDSPMVEDSNSSGQNLVIKALITILNDQHQKIAALELENNNLKSSWIKKLTLQVRKMKRKMFPPGSRSAYILGKITKLFKPD